MRKKSNKFAPRKTASVQLLVFLTCLTLLVVLKPYTGLHSEPKATAINYNLINNDIPAGQIIASFISASANKRASEMVKKEPQRKTAAISIAKAVPATQAITSPKTVKATYEGKSPEVIAVIEQYASEYKVNAEIMKSIAFCESGFNPSAVNGPFAGIYQFLSTTWVSNRKAMGLDPDPNLRYDAREAARTAAFKMSRDGFGAWPACSKKALSA